MNKFAILAVTVLGFVGCVLSAGVPSQSAHEAEIANLPPNQAMFGDFCQKSHDLIREIALDTFNVDERVFKSLLGTPEEVREELAKAESEGILPVGSGDSSLWNMMSNFGNFVLKQVIGKETTQNLIDRSKLWLTVAKSIEETCRIPSAHAIGKLSDLLKEEKAKLVEGLQGDAQKVKEIEQVELESIQCLSVGRLQKITKVCGIVNYNMLSHTIG